MLGFFNKMIVEELSSVKASLIFLRCGELTSILIFFWDIPMVLNLNVYFNVLYMAFIKIFVTLIALLLLLLERPVPSACLSVAS